MLKALAIATLVLVGFVGPLVSLQYGPERALILVMPPIYLSALLSLIYICSKRVLLRLRKRDLTLLFAELLVCPVLLVNVFKKIALHQPQVCTTDLLGGGFAVDKLETTERLRRYSEATAQ
jgi:hypothetical protein